METVRFGLKKDAQCFDALLLLQKIAAEQKLPNPTLTSFKPTASFLMGAKELLYAVVDERFVCAHERKSGVMKATWCKGWKSIKWNPNETTQMRRMPSINTNRRAFGILDTPLETWCSSHPKAERIAEIEQCNRNVMFGISIQTSDNVGRTLNLRIKSNTVNGIDSTLSNDSKPHPMTRRYFLRKPTSTKQCGCGD